MLREWLVANVTPFVSFVLSGFILAALLSLGLRFLPLDIPNARSVHTLTIPRSGGVAILGGAWAGWIMLPDFPASLFWCSLGLSVVSLLDDKFRLPVVPRLLVQIALIAAFLLAGPSDAMFFPVVLLALVWGTNLYNFMDGADGIAGGMTLIGFTCYGLAAWFAGDHVFAVLCFCVAVSAAPFLAFNFHPAKIFMGDVGSVPLGFLAGALGYVGWHSKIWPLWYPVLVFSPFIVDASVTLLKRLVAREKFWLPHKSHYYQRYLLMGAGHRRTSLVEFALMLGCGVSAWVALFLHPLGQQLLLVAWLFTYAALAIFVDTRWRKFSNASS